MPFLKHRSPSLSQSWSATTASALSCYVATISRRHYIAMGDLFIEFYRRIGNQDKHYLYIVFKISPPHSTISLAQECLGAPMLFLADGLCNAFPAWARVSSSCVFPGADLFHHSLWHLSTWKHFPKRPLPFIFHELCPLSQSAHVSHADLAARLENRSRTHNLFDGLPRETYFWIVIPWRHLVLHMRSVVDFLVH